jgi:hypothetical protein
MPTTPQPTGHPDSNDDLTSTNRKEPTITMNSDSPCPCGALAERDGLCRKCRARATWERRRANQARHVTRRPSRPGRRDRDTSHPQGRRPGH